MNDQNKSAFDDPTPEGGAVSENAVTTEPAALETVAPEAAPQSTVKDDSEPEAAPKAETKPDDSETIAAPKKRGRPPGSSQSKASPDKNMDALNEKIDGLILTVQSIDVRLANFMQAQQVQVMNLNRTIASMRQQPAQVRDPMNSPPLRPQQ